jgi:plastocyanin
MSRVRYPATLVLSLLLAGTSTFLACAGSSDSPSNPTQTVASISLTASATDTMASFGDTRTISANAKDASSGTIASPAVTWSSSAPTIATVSASGATATVTAAGNGTATITASSGSAQAVVSMTVVQRAAAIALSGAPASLLPGATAQLTADARDARSRSVSGVTGFTYASTNQAVAVVNTVGKITAIAPGNVIITSAVTVNGVNLSGTTGVTVAFATSNPVSAAVGASDQNLFTPANVTIGAGGTVTWSFATVQHNVTFGAAGAPANIVNSSGTSATRTFATPGTFDYDCTLHPGMHGTVVVQSASTPPAYPAILSGVNERPTPVVTAGAGAAYFTLNGGTVTYVVTFSGLTGVPSMSHIHAPGSATQTAGVLVDFPVTGQTANSGVITRTFTAAPIRNARISIDSLLSLMRTGNAYVNVHTTQFPGGEIRGQTSVP